jgi:Protein of unknown function (DUF2934)
MNMKSTGKQPGNQSTGQSQQAGKNPQEQISRRAYELYLERGEQSDPSQNWLDAEREFLGAHGQPMTEQTQAVSVRRES